VIGSLHPALRRALALAILFAVPLVLWLAVAEPLIAVITDRQAEIATLAERMARLKATIARIPDLRRSEAESNQRLEAASGVWTGTSEAALAATVQDRLRQAVSSSDGVVKSTSHLRGADEGGLQTVRIRFSIEGSLATVEQALAVIETSRPVMFVDNMTIAAPASFSLEMPPLLGLDLEVIGYMRTTPQ
jgi:general secretion pathway protein M